MAPAAIPARLVLLLGILVASLVVVAAPGTRFGLWHYRTAFQMWAVAAAGGCGVAAFALIALLVPRWRAGGTSLIVAGLVLGAVGTLVPWLFARQARGVPAIHDIATDLEDPPAFVAVLPLRGDKSNPVTSDPAVAAQQRAAYPDLQPLDLALPPGAAFERALAAVRESGWELVAADGASGRIEATATTPAFGFRDDVVIRVRPHDAGSRVDMRSVSRVGKSDVGANAKRIRAFFALLAR